VTAYGRARALADHADHADHAIHATHADGPLPAGVVPVEIDVDRVEDHDRPTFEIESGVRWRWTDPDAERRDADVRAGLARLAGLEGRADGAQPS
jgi:hypothetical protein